MQTNNNQQNKFPLFGRASHQSNETLDLTITNFFTAYPLKEAKEQLIYLLTSWVYEDKYKTHVEDGTKYVQFSSELAHLVTKALNSVDMGCPCVAQAKEVLVGGFGLDKTEPMLHDILLSNFCSDRKPKRLEIANYVSHCNLIIDLMSALSKKGGFSC